jgi:hypothetical protein
MKQNLLLSSQQTYIPAIMISRATLKYSWSRLPVATNLAPEETCGKAIRIGYTGRLDNDLALYRLKIKQGNGLPTVTLPNIYIIEEGLFLDYEQWKQSQNEGKVSTT